MSQSSDYYEPPPDYSDSESETPSNLMPTPNDMQSDRGSQTKTSLQSHADTSTSLHPLTSGNAVCKVNLIPVRNLTESHRHEQHQKMGNDSPALLMSPESGMSTSCTTITFSTSDDGRGEVGAAIRPRRSLSVKSIFVGEDRKTADRMKPLINEFRFYQKTQKSILGQKSELQRAIEKRQARERLRHAEPEKTGLEKVLELRALKISNSNGITFKPPIDSSSPTHSPSLNISTVWRKGYEHSIKPALSHPPVTQANKVTTTLASSTTSRSLPMDAGQESHRRPFVKIMTAHDVMNGRDRTPVSGDMPNSGEKIGHVKLILKTIESNRLNRSHDKTAKLKEHAGKYTGKQFDYAGSWTAGGSSSSSLSPSSSSSSTCSSNKIPKV